MRSCSQGTMGPKVKAPWGRTDDSGWEAPDMENIRDLTTKIRIFWDQDWESIAQRQELWANQEWWGYGCNSDLHVLSCFPIVISPDLDPVAIKDVQMHEIRPGSQRPSRLRGQHRQVARQHRGPHADLGRHRRQLHDTKRQEAEARTGQGTQAEQKGPTVPWAQPCAMQGWDWDGLGGCWRYYLCFFRFKSSGTVQTVGGICMLVMLLELFKSSGAVETWLWTCNNQAEHGRKWHLEVEERVTGSPSMARPHCGSKMIRILSWTAKPGLDSSCTAMFWASMFDVMGSVIGIAAKQGSWSSKLRIKRKRKQSRKLEQRREMQLPSWSVFSPLKHAIQINPASRMVSLLIPKSTGIRRITGSQFFGMSRPLRSDVGSIGAGPKSSKTFKNKVLVG